MNKISTSLILPLFFLIAVAMISSSGGRDDRRANAPGDSSGCEGCHGGGSGSVTGNLMGAPSIIIPGNTYTLTLSAGDFGSGVEAGFQIAASSGASFPTNVGTFTPTAGTRINATNRLVHSTPQAYSSGIASWTFDWTAPTENTYSEVTFFYSINSSNNGGGTSDDVTFSGNSANIPVPVNWAYSRVETNKNINSIYWGTYSEDNTASFEIEHSIDGVNFKFLESIEAAFSSRVDQHYQFDDERVLSGKSYYRIKQIDVDGNFAYSEVLLVENAIESFQVYPTIFRDIVQIDGKNEGGSIRVFDLNGKEMFNGNFINRINLQLLPEAIYVIVIEDKNGRVLNQADKIIKL